ncbi:AAA family ATPase [Spirosoma litoris]
MENTAPNTNNFLNWVEIKNFKSIKDLRLDCKRVNVFIGKPNVGKSNILEGLGLLGAEYGIGKFMGGLVRYKEIKNLFYDSDLTNSVSAQSDHQIAGLYAQGLGTTHEIDFSYFLADQDDIKKHAERGDIELLEQWSAKKKYVIDKNGEYGHDYSGAVDRRANISTVKKYDFANLTDFANLFQDFLLPPNGSNLYEIVKRSDDLASDFVELFREQKLDFIFDENGQTFLIQRKKGPRVFQNEFFSIADTFRRFMFYITAIESNKNSVIVFEEPEVHSFPPYTQEMAYRMIYDEDNQYFISTHSPYMLQPFIEKMDFNDLNVFITYYKDYQTHVRALTEEELTDILDFSTNVFFNLRKFEPNA